jgi:hypothetical protein
MWLQCRWLLTVVVVEKCPGARPRDPKKRLVKKADDKKAHEIFNEPMKNSKGP